MPSGHPSSPAQPAQRCSSTPGCVPGGAWGSLPSGSALLVRAPFLQQAGVRACEVRSGAKTGPPGPRFPLAGARHWMSVAPHAAEKISLGGETKQFLQALQGIARYRSRKIVVVLRSIDLSMDAIYTLPSHVEAGRQGAGWFG